MGKLISPAAIRSAHVSGVSRVRWGYRSLQHRSARRSHAAASAPTGSGTEALAITEEEKIELAALESGVGSELEVVSEQYDKKGELDEAAMASKYGVKRDENGDIVFAQLDDEGKLTFDPNVEPYDPMYHGKWVDIDGVEVKVPDYDFSQHDWILRVENDIGWPFFWRHFEDLTSTDEEYVDGEETYTESGRLALHSESKRHEALEAQEVLAGSPLMAAPGLDADEPNQIEDPTIVDRERRGAIDAWELRAIREKQLAREQWDLYWVVQQMERVDMINHPPDEQRDVRYAAKLRGERFDWTDEQIQDVVTSEGRGVDPYIVLNAPTFKVQNPYHMPDYASQGIPYLDDMEDWLETEGRWMDQQNLSEVGEDDDKPSDQELTLEGLTLQEAATASDEEAFDSLPDGFEDEHFTWPAEDETVTG